MNYLGAFCFFNDLYFDRCPYEISLNDSNEDYSWEEDIIHQYENRDSSEKEPHNEQYTKRGVGDET